MLAKLINDEFLSGHCVYGDHIFGYSHLNDTFHHWKLSNGIIDSHKAVESFRSNKNRISLTNTKFMTYVVIKTPGSSIQIPVETKDLHHFGTTFLPFTRESELISIL